MITFISVVLGLVVGAAVFTLSLRFEEEVSDAVMKAVVAGIWLMITNILASKAPPVASVLLAFLLFAVEGYMIYWWKKEGSDVRELLLAAVIDLLITLTAQAGIVRIRDITTVRWVISWFESMPLMIFVVSLAFFIADMFWFRDKLRKIGG